MDKKTNNFKIRSRHNANAKATQSVATISKGKTIFPLISKSNVVFKDNFEEIQKKEFDKPFLKQYQKYNLFLTLGMIHFPLQGDFQKD